MGQYNVVQPCVVAGRHYARPTAQPIAIDDDAAAPLVEAGKLEPVIDSISTPPAPGRQADVPQRPEDAGRQAGEEFAECVAAAAAEEPESTPRRRSRKHVED